MAEVGAVLVHGLLQRRLGVGRRARPARGRRACRARPSSCRLTSLEDDVAATVAELDRFGKPAVLVGHSYGGAVVTAAGEHPHVRHLLYLAAFALAEGESVSSALPDRDIPPTGLGEALRFSAEGQQVSVDPALAVEPVLRRRTRRRRGGRGRPASARPPVAVPRGARHHRLAISAVHLRRVRRRPHRAPRPAAGHGRARDRPAGVARRPHPHADPSRPGRRPDRRPGPVIASNGAPRRSRPA